MPRGKRKQLGVTQPNRRSADAYAREAKRRMARFVAKTKS